ENQGATQIDYVHSCQNLIEKSLYHALLYHLSVPTEALSQQAPLHDQRSSHMSHLDIATLFLRLTKSPH
ncbi:hypothetical protein BDZ91DRAFT_726574, partial [Kalaharituber pfeilii]